MKYILFSFCLVLSACQSSTKSHNEFLKSWLGKSEADLVATWGAPVNMETMPGGNQVFTYIKEYSVQNDFGGKLIYYCQINFETQNDIIVNFSTNGDGCEK